MFGKRPPHLGAHAPAVVNAPPAKNFIAVEHQTNFADPFGKEWGGKDTDMITLAPGKSTQWHVRVKVFVP